jgi:hypothetical protein
MKSTRREWVHIPRNERVQPKVWLAAILFAALVGTGTGTAFAGKPHPVVDAPAPDLQVTTFDGRKLSLADFKGQPAAAPEPSAIFCRLCPVSL